MVYQVVQTREQINSEQLFAITSRHHFRVPRHVEGPGRLLGSRWRLRHWHYPLHCRDDLQGTENGTSLFSRTQSLQSAHNMKSLFCIAIFEFFPLNSAFFNDNIIFSSTSTTTSTAAIGTTRRRRRKRRYLASPPLSRRASSFLALCQGSEKGIRESARDEETNASY